MGRLRWRLHRWLVVTVSHTKLLAFLNKSITLHQLLLSDKDFIYRGELTTYDTDDNLDIVGEHIYTIDTIPTNYLLTTNTMYSEEHYTPYCEQLKQKLICVEQIKSNTWQIK